MKKLHVTFFLLLLTYAAGAQTKTGWTPEQILKMKHLTAVRVSPDGKQVVYAVREAVMTEDRSEYINQLYLADAAGKNTIQLTRGDRNNSNPKWSPDGKRIAFISNRDGKNNLYVLPLSGGESERLTDVKTAISDFEWSPDGKAIAYTMNDALSEAEEKNKRGKNDWYFMGEDHKQGRLYVLWLNDKDTTGKQKVLKLTQDNRHISSLSWSPDGTWIAYRQALSPGISDNIYSDIAMVHVASGAVKSIAATPAGEWQPLFSPDGKWIAYRATEDPVVWGGKTSIKVVAAGGGQPITLAHTPDESGALLGWSANSQYVYIYEPYHTLFKIYQLSVDGKGMQEWSAGNKDHITTIELNDKGTHFGMVLQNPTRTADAYVSRAAKFAPVKISNINPWVADFPIPRTEVIRWKSFDGKEIEGLLIYPLSYQAGKTYPLVVQIHGGPAGGFSQTFPLDNFHRYPLAAFAERGMFVLRPNPRGSWGYGAEFRQANQRDWGGGDYQDIMAGVDYTIARGWVDSTRMGVMGWSYGGFMTGWIIGHTNRFKAASLGAPAIELVSTELTADLAGFLPSYMKKLPWEDWAVYDEHSPLRFVHQVNTPVLLQHGEVDVNVPFSQSVLWYNALKRRGVPVRFLVLSRQAHGQTEPKMVLKVQQTNLEWMEHYLLGKPKSF